MKEISPRTKEKPTITFQLSKYNGLGLNFEITAPDIKKPDVIAKIAVGPERKYQTIFSLIKRLCQKSLFYYFMLI